MIFSRNIRDFGSLTPRLMADSNIEEMVSLPAIEISFLNRLARPSFFSAVSKVMFPMQLLSVVGSSFIFCCPRPRPRPRPLPRPAGEPRPRRLLLCGELSPLCGGNIWYNASLKVESYTYSLILIRRCLNLKLHNRYQIIRKCNNAEDEYA